MQPARAKDLFQYSAVSVQFLISFFKKPNPFDSSGPHITFYCPLPRTAFSNRLSLLILRLPTGVDFSDLECEIGSPSLSTSISVNNSEVDLRAAAIHKPFKRQLMHVDSNLHMDTMVRSASSSSVSNNDISIVVPQMREYIECFLGIA